jgi:hypothetical protein
MLSPIFFNVLDSVLDGVLDQGICCMIFLGYFKVIDCCRLQLDVFSCQNTSQVVYYQFRIPVPNLAAILYKSVKGLGKLKKI